MDYKFIKFLAARFARSGRRKRFLNFARVVAFISVLLGSAALIISLAILEGFDTALYESAVKFRSHITIRAFSGSILGNSKQNLKKIRNHKGIRSAWPVIEREGLVRSKKYFEGIVIRGIDSSFKFTRFRNNLVRGSFVFDSDSSKQIIIGERLAEKLDVSTGDKLVLYTIENKDISSSVSAHIDQFIVSGIYRTGMAQYDDIVCYIPFKTAGRFFRMPENTISAYEIMLNDVGKVNIINSELESELGYPHFGRTVFDLHRSIFAWIELQKKPIPIVLGLISIVAVLNIITTLLVTVVEKTNSIGILRSMGLNGKGILKVFIYQGMKIGLYGALTGGLISLLFSLAQKYYGIITLDGDIYFLDVLPVQIVWWHYLLVISISLILSFLSTLIPSFAAVRISPLRAIRFR